MNKWMTGVPLAALLIAAAGCGGGDASSAIGLAKNPRIRLMNAMPGTTVDAIFVGDRVLDNVTSPTISEYQIEDNGNHDADFRDSATDGVVASLSNALYEEDKYYTVVAAGTGGNRTVFRVEDNRQDPDNGTGKVRVVNADQAAGNVDVFITPEGDDDLGGVVPTSDDLAFGSQDPGYLERAAGNYRIRIYNSDDSTLLGDQTISLGGGQLRTVWLVETTGAMQLFITTDKGD